MIRNCYDLLYIENYDEVYLMNDIDATETQYWNGGKGFKPIGVDGYTGWSGKFYGQGHKISNLYQNWGTSEYGGMFYKLNDGGLIEKLGLENLDITAGNEIGGLCAYVFGTISQCYTTGSVNGDCGVGGLFYSLDGNGLVKDCYSTADLTGNSEMGGLGGSIDSANAEIYHCYSTGAVPTGEDYGGLIGLQALGTCDSCYWDITTSGQSDSKCGTGKTTSQMYNEQTYSGWDIQNSDIWDINDGNTYPWLKTFD